MIYIDPGAGSLIFQALAAGFVAVLTTFSRVRRFFTNLFGRIRGK